MAARSVLCRLTDLDRTGAKGITVEVGSGRLDIVVVRDAGGRVRAYENNCPHLKIPLEAAPDRFLDAEREHLVCSMHGARFAAGDGFCVSGPCQGARLTTIGIDVGDGEVWLKGSA